MGECKEKRGYGRLLAAVALALSIILSGCSSAKRQQAEVGADIAPSSVGAATSVRAPAQIDTMNLADEGRTASLELAADRPLVWTSFRNPEGDLVIELPNSVPPSSAGDLGSPSGLVRSVDVERLDDSDRPLTRLVVRTSTPSEHSLAGDGNRLVLQLLPIDSSQEVTLAYEPVEEVEPEEDLYTGSTTTDTYADSGSAPAASAGVPQTYGTPDAPQLGPSPTGVAATQLYSVDILDSGASTVVRVAGDGEFVYSTFRLENPERFVIDLEGVVNTGASSTVSVSSDSVDQIRIGQFKPRPEPVSRVVFDLNDQGVPAINRTADGLVVTFGDAAMAGDANVYGTVADSGMSDSGTPSSGSDYSDPMADTAMTEPEPEAVEVVAEQGTMADSYDMADDSMAAEDTYDVSPPAAQTAQADSVPTWTPPPSSPPPSAAPSVPVYQPPGSTLDVSALEAQQPLDVDLDAEGRTQQERLLESFGSLIVSRQEREYVGEPISMSLKNADLVETLRSFAKISDLNFVIQPGVRGTVTVELKSVPWDQAMEQILKINNLGMDIDGTIVRIAPRNKLREEAEEDRRIRQARAQSIPLRTVMRSLSYAQAGAVARLLKTREGAIMSRRGNVQVDPRTNTLIIRELPDNIDTVLAVIDNLDTPEPQVTIEARIVEATKNFSRSLGVSWDWDYSANQSTGNTTGLQFPNNLDADGGVGLLTGGASGFLNLSMGNILDTFRLNARLQIAENEGLVNIISAPRITTLNNNAASIQSGLQIPIQTVTDRTVSVQFVNATLRLQVTPQVTAEGTVVLTINVAKRTPQLGLAIQGATNAPIATKEARTKVIVRDGGTAVIGGIYEVSSNQTQDRVPGLANIPVLGHLFKNRNRNDNNDELMIFITPRIVQM